MRPCVHPPLIIRGVEFGGPKPLFCIPLVATDLNQLLSQADVAHRLQADLVEWRADSYGELTPDSLLEAARALRGVLEREPILFTLRIAKEGGAREMPQDLRLSCIDAMLRSEAIDLADVELCNGPQILQTLIRTAHDYGRKIIISFHDFHSTPTNEEMFGHISVMVKHGADVAKIACMPREPEDVLRLLQVTLSARKAFPNVPLCMTSMSSLGLLSRVAGFLYGSDMAFAAGAASSAPGQIAIGEARALAEGLLRHV